MKVPRLLRFNAVVWGMWGCAFSLAPCPVPRAPAFAAERPSLFRGITVADSQLGVRVINVEASSQAYEADLRPEDIIVRVHDAEIHSIDEFALISNTLKGRTFSTKIVVFRNGTPRELVLHLYSYPILRAWGVAFIPDHDLRFALPEIGGEYWRRMGRGFEGAGKEHEALEAYLNGLHHLPSDVLMAVKVAALFSRVGQATIGAGDQVGGLEALRSSLRMMQKLFEYPLTDEQLRIIRDQLRGTLTALRGLSAQPAVPP